jgi:CRISPR-associated protein Csd2
MADETTSVPEFAKLSARDSALSEVITPEFLERFEVHSYRNASRILATACKSEFAELVEALMSFSIQTDDVVKPGGNKSVMAKSVDELLNPKGWRECRIRGDLVVKRTTVVPNPKFELDGAKKGEKKTVADEQLYRIDGFIDGHKIDFVKNRVAFDVEWNSKDQTFDRDLYAARTFYECGIVDAAILLTRSKSLGPVFAEIGSRVNMPNFKSKYGASTTWMGKLLYRLDAGRGGGCPILAIGIKPPVIGDFDAWKLGHPPIAGKELAVEDLTDEDDVEEDGED